MSVGSSPMLAVATILRPRPQAVRGGVLGAGDEQRGRAVDDARRIAGMVHVGDLEPGELLQDQRAVGGPVLVQGDVRQRLEGRGQRGQRVDRRPRPWVLLTVQRQRPVEMVHRHERLVEAPLLDRDLGPALGFGRQLVDGPAVDLLQGGDGIRGHALIRLGMDGAQVVVAAVEEGRARLRRRWRRRTTSSRCRRRRPRPPCRPTRWRRRSSPAEMPDPQKRSRVTPLAVMA